MTHFHVCVVLQTVLSMEHVMATPILAAVHAKSLTSQPISASDPSPYVVMSVFVSIILGEHQ